jgi:hypothetical protein
MYSRECWYLYDEIGAERLKHHWVCVDLGEQNICRVHYVDFDLILALAGKLSKRSGRKRIITGSLVQEFFGTMEKTSH